MAIISIDGPSGTGKSSVSSALAAFLGLPHLDTGAFYRAATIAVLDAGADPDDPLDAFRAVEEAQIDQIDDRTYLNDRDVSDEIRADRVDVHVSAVSAHPAVRGLMVGLQRAWVEAHGGSAVVEGRDIGSVVFPAAEVKIYLDAAPEVRARRRALERGADHDEIAEAIDRRDRFDTTRSVSPLVVPEGAVLVDTSDMTLESVLERLLEVVASRS